MPFTIVRDDLSRMHVDAVVNPTGGVFVTPGGTEAALIRAAGGELRRAIRKMWNLPLDFRRERRWRWPRKPSAVFCSAMT